MKKKIFLCLLIIIFVLSGCVEQEDVQDEYLNSIISEVADNKYDNQIIEVSNRINDDEARKVIQDAYESQYIKAKRTFIFRNEETASPMYLHFITGQLLEESDLIEKIGTMVYIPLGRRYVIVERYFLEELTSRKVVIVIEADENDKIIEPYHCYVFDIKIIMKYRGEGATAVASYGVESFEYGRQPDIIKE